VITRRDGSVTLLVSNFGPFIGRIGVLSQNFTLFEVRIVLDAFTRDLAGSRLDSMLRSVFRAGDDWLKPGDQGSDCSCEDGRGPVDEGCGAGW
jgi:hypothetical protein